MGLKMRSPPTYVREHNAVRDEPKRGQAGATSLQGHSFEEELHFINGNLLHFCVLFPEAFYCDAGIEAVQDHRAPRDVCKPDFRRLQ